MAFGGGGSGFTFGNQNNNQSSGFGAFGNNNNNNTSSAFGQSSGGGLFGSNNNNASSSTFGGGGSAFGGGGGFGATNSNTGSSLFGGNKASTGFGSSTNTSGGGLFGSTNNNTTSGGLFGNNNNATSNTSSVFGNTSNTSGGLFGSNNNTNTNNSPFGSSQNKGLFGQAGAGTTGGFGSSSPFGGGTGTALNTPVPPCQGTAAPPFEPFNETEANGSKSSFQTITFMQPYSKYSLEELRLADYNAGRRYGNGQSGTGAFGQTNFGGFGNTSSGSAFGNTNTSTPFGQTTQSSAFGSNTATTGSAFGGGGGLFGNNNNNQQKPGGLFGSTNTTTTGGGLFGSNNTQQQQSGGLFGNNNNTNTGGGLFGNNNQNKPGGLFGSNTATANTTTNTGGFSFGNTANNTSNTTGGGLFGNNNNSANTGGGLFGNNQQQQQQNNTGGGLFGNTNNQANNSGGLFGNKTNTFGTPTTNTQQSGGLFGNTNNNTSSGGLFGNTNTNTNTSGGLFGNTNNQQQSGGLFGNNNNNQNKPGGLFGNTTTNTGGSLFGNTNTTGNTGGGIFGNNNNTQQSGSLFGNNNNTNTGSSLFGNNANTNTGGSLFGNNQNQNKPGGLFGNSTGGGLFNQSQNNQQAQQQPDFKVSSLLDPNPYGQSSIWTGLPAPTPENAKPVFTPLAATQKLKESAMKPIPSLRLNQSRYMTPPRRNGYGLSYSTYGTPSSVSSTPGANSLSLTNSMYGSKGWSGGSFGRSFSKSASVQNLRAQYDSNSDEIFKSHAFAPGHRNSSGSIKRLTIDRSVRNDLFSKSAQPALPAPKPVTNGITETSSSQSHSEIDPSQKLKKRVSFENDIQNSQFNGTTGALVRTEEDSEEDSTPPRRITNGDTEATRNGELAAVPEDQATNHVSTASRSVRVEDQSDPKPGDYWMKPTRQEMSKMPREQLQHFKGFKVGRQGCGEVTFDGSVDLTSLPLDDLYENIVEIRVRAVTVYPDANKKPPAGKGLNVPSTIKILNSWPRNRGGQPSSDTSGPVFDKHITRLKKMTGTDFVSYDPPSGVWVFKVPHYTRYGLDYDDDDEMDQSELSLPPTSLEKSADTAVMEVDDDNDSFEHEADDDTFAFKKSLPGGYGRQSMIDYDSDPAANDPVSNDERSERSAYSDDDYMSEDEVNPTMPGSLPEPRSVVPDTPAKPVLKPTAATPGKPLLDLEGDWADQLQRTISPRKQNRDVLRDAQSRVLLDRAYQPIKPKQAAQTSFKNSIDIMNSLFEPASGRATKSKKASKAAEPDFEFPYAKRAKTFDARDEDMSNADRSWHDSLKPHFTTDGKLLYKSRQARQSQGATGLVNDSNGTVYETKLSEAKDFDLQSALLSVDVQLEKGVPKVEQRASVFSDLAARQAPSSTLHDFYQLAHVLFDEYDDEYNQGMKSHIKKQFVHRIRKDRLTALLSKLISNKLEERITDFEKEDPTAAAFLHLTAHDIPKACNVLAKSKNNRLMLLVSQLDGADEAFMDDIAAQLSAWRDQGVLPEITEEIRAVYELCAGNVTISEGKTNGAIPVEDRAATFSLSDKFQLTWLQAFALGLWYGRDEKLAHKDTDSVGRIEDAIREFQARLDRGEEAAKPDGGPLWTLLRLYAAHQEDSGVDQPAVPADLLGLVAARAPFDSSALFEVTNSLGANLTWLDVDTEKLDTLSETLAFELSSRNDLASAVFALLHLSSPNMRKQHITDLLHRFAPVLPGADTATTDAGIALWQTLTINLRLPQAWIYNAKAAFAASPAGGMDNVAELKWLVAAEEWQAAHQSFVKRVAPAAVIDEDWQTIIEYVTLFGDAPATRALGWQNYDGGSVFEDLALLMTKQRGDDLDFIDALRRKIVRLGQDEKKREKEAKDTEAKLLGNLSLHELDSHVAIREMSRHVASLLSNGSANRSISQRKEILQMPLTSDVRLAQTLGLASEYFDNVTSRSGGGTGKSGTGRVKGTRAGKAPAVDDSEDVEMDTDRQTA